MSIKNGGTGKRNSGLKHRTLIRITLILYLREIRFKEIAICSHK